MALTTYRSGLTPLITVYTPRGGTTVTQSQALAWAYRLDSEMPETTKRPKPLGLNLLLDPTSRSWARTEIINPGFSHSFNNYYGSGSYSGLASHFISVGANWPTEVNVQNELRACITDVRNKLKGQRVNLAVAFAELGQTIDMFTSAATQAVKLYRELRHGLKSAAKKFRRWNQRDQLQEAAANVWLTYTYGVKPLISDLNGLLYEAETARPYVVKVRAQRSAEKFFSTRAYLAMTDSYYYRLASCTTSVRVKAIGVINNPAANLFTRLGLTNPAELAWEIIPYSFVFDWFVNVGDVLSSLDALVGYDHVSAALGVKSKYVENCGYGAQYKRETLSRSPTTIPPQFFSWEPTLTKQRLLSACALLAQAREGR